MLEYQSLGILVDMRYAWTWRQNVDVAIEQFQLKAGSKCRQSALRYVIEPVRHSRILLPDVGIHFRPRLTSRLEEVHVPFGLDLTNPEQIKRRVEVLQEDYSRGGGMSW